MSERPNPPEAREAAGPTPDTARGMIADLAKARGISRDQERIADSALQNPDFALLANRAMNQGTDPELLRRVAPASVEKVADKLGLTIEEAEKAIQTAHRSGPGSFVKDSKEEWLWLILAEHSVDESQKSDKPEEVLLASARKIVGFEQYAGGKHDFEKDARAYREKIIEKTQPVASASQGKDVKLYDSDLGFYAAYRSGESVAAVKDKKGLVFYGTDGSKTLKEAGITVDKELSPTFGIVFPKQETK